MGLISELRRRNVFRMAVLYVVVAWLIMQVADVLIDLAKLPDWVGTTTLWLVAVGFPIAVIFSWFYELTPEGISLEKDVDPAESITHVTGRRIDFVVISLLCAAVILFAYDKWWPRGPIEQSVAVLPFVNMSDDPEQEYFSDGISEEILNLLTRVPELKVISRSSAFSFKGQNVDIPTIAAKLNVVHVLEGSVRRSDDQLRITAKLIDVESDTQLWSKTYDREIKSVFAIQDEIAAAVVDALKITLLGDKPRVSETDPDAYALYLLGRHFRNQFTAESNKRAEASLKQALEIVPEFAPAWTELGDVYSDQANRFGTRPVDEAYQLAREAILQALDADPQYARAHAALGDLEIHYAWDFTTAYQFMQQALALNMGDTYILQQAAHLEHILGRADTAIELYRQVIALDPASPGGHVSLGLMYYRTSRLEEAADSVQLGLSLMPDHPTNQYRLGCVLLAQGDAQAALTAMEKVKSDFRRLQGLALVQHALGNAGASNAALQQFIGQWAKVAAYQIAEIYAFRNEVDLAFDWLEQAYDQRDTGLPFMLLDPLFSNLHEDPRWELLLDKMGLPH